LRENILYEAPESVSDEDVSKVIARTGIQEMQKRFEQKEKAWNLETTVSGGERQRINLARALLKNGSIYIFDEATSALDTETEKIVQQTLRELSKTKVVIIISHRLSSVRKADKIYVLDEGSVQENGSHEELMKKKGRYYRLFEEQVKKNDEKQITG
ncbi:MAG: ATP-binding cassette domain-containing protein, partial [Dialister sp.]|nr:ATP-binding cassette domain-containing protein [Dialister sp.]